MEPPLMMGHINIGGPNNMGHLLLMGPQLIMGHQI